MKPHHLPRSAVPACELTDVLANSSRVLRVDDGVCCVSDPAESLSMDLDRQVHVLDERAAVPVERAEDRRPVSRRASWCNGDDPERVLAFPVHPQAKRVVERSERRQVVVSLTARGAAHEHGFGVVGERLQDGVEVARAPRDYRRRGWRRMRSVPRAQSVRWHVGGCRPCPFRGSFRRTFTPAKPRRTSPVRSEEASSMAYTCAASRPASRTLATQRPINFSSLRAGMTTQTPPRAAGREKVTLVCAFDICPYSRQGHCQSREWAGSPVFSDVKSARRRRGFRSWLPGTRRNALLPADADAISLTSSRRDRDEVVRSSRSRRDQARHAVAGTQVALLHRQSDD